MEPGPASESGDDIVHDDIKLYMPSGDPVGAVDRSVFLCHVYSDHDASQKLKTSQAKAIETSLHALGGFPSLNVMIASIVRRCSTGLYLRYSFAGQIAHLVRDALESFPWPKAINPNTVEFLVQIASGPVPDEAQLRKKEAMSHIAYKVVLTDEDLRFLDKWSKGPSDKKEWFQMMILLDYRNGDPAANSKTAETTLRQRGHFSRKTFRRIDDFQFCGYGPRHQFIQVLSPRPRELCKHEDTSNELGPVLQQAANSSKISTLTFNQVALADLVFRSISPALDNVDDLLNSRLKGITVAEEAEEEKGEKEGEEGREGKYESELRRTADEKRKIDLDNWEKNLDNREKNLDSREKNLDSRDKSLDNQDKNLRALKTKLDKQRDTLNEQKTDFEEKRGAFERRMEEQKQKVEEEREQLKAERARINGLEREVKRREEREKTEQQGKRRDLDQKVSNFRRELEHFRLSEENFEKSKKHYEERESQMLQQLTKVEQQLLKHQEEGKTRSAQAQELEERLKSEWAADMKDLMDQVERLQHENKARAEKAEQLEEELRREKGGQKTANIGIEIFDNSSTESRQTERQFGSDTIKDIHARRWERELSVRVLKSEDDWKDKLKPDMVLFLMHKPGGFGLDDVEERVALAKEEHRYHKDVKFFCLFRDQKEMIKMLAGKAARSFGGKWTMIHLGSGPKKIDLTCISYVDDSNHPHDKVVPQLVGEARAIYEKKVEESRHHSKAEHS